MKGVYFIPKMMSSFVKGADGEIYGMCSTREADGQKTGVKSRREMFRIDYL